MDTPEVKCTYMIKIDDGKDEQGRPKFFLQRCGASASERTLEGMLTSTKAILCDRHEKLAERQSYISERGYPLGKIENPKPGKERVKQVRIKCLF